MAAVWLDHDTKHDIVRVYDAQKFDREVLIVITEAMATRGKWIPVVWEAGKSDLIETFPKRRPKFINEPVKESPEFVDGLNRQLWERMRTGRFKADVKLKAWVDELAPFTKAGGKIGTQGAPLISATRYALAKIQRARIEPPKAKPEVHHQGIAII